MLLLVVLFLMLISYSSIDGDKLSHAKEITETSPTITSHPDMDQAINSLQKLSTEWDSDHGLTVNKTEDGFMAVFPNPLLFKSGEASLNKSVFSVLDGIIQIANNNNLSIQVEGHTDNQPIETAQFPSNWELSTLRAVNILRYLQETGGIPARRLSAVGFAEFQPEADNDTAEGRNINRRIVIRFRSDK
jgi:chemotaxis protein MotB